MLIPSQNSLFRGEMVEKPRLAIVVGHDADGWSIYACPNCGHRASIWDCDVLGAEPGCAFCNQCHQEFEA